MASTTLYTGHNRHEDGKLVSTPDPIYPFLDGVGIYSVELVEGTDYTEGDDIVIEVEQASKLLWVGITDDAGAFKAYAEAAGTSSGRKVTVTGAAGADKYKVLIIWK